MDLLAAMFAAPAAASSAFDAAAGVASSAARPFADIFSALAQPAEPTEESDDEGASLHDRIAERLQEILEAAGVKSGDCATVRFDPETDEVEVTHCGAAGDEAAAAISQDAELMDDLRRMAELDAASDDRVELLVQVA